MKIAHRVEVYGFHENLLYRAHREDAARLLKANQAEPMQPGEVKAIRLLGALTERSERDPHRPSSNSLRAGYMQSLSGGHTVSIDTPAETRQVVTRGCRTYKLKAIHSSLAPLYRLAVTDNLVAAQ